MRHRALRAKSHISGRCGLTPPFSASSPYKAFIKSFIGVVGALFFFGGLPENPVFEVFA
jgi:hypothetical protein